MSPKSPPSLAPSLMSISPLLGVGEGVWLEEESAGESSRDLLASVGLSVNSDKSFFNLSKSFFLSFSILSLSRDKSRPCFPPIPGDLGPGPRPFFCLKNQNQFSKSDSLRDSRPGQPRTDWIDYLLHFLH